MLRREISYTDLTTADGLSSEESLFVSRLCANEDAAYDELVRTYHTGIYHLACRMLSDPAESADVTQDVFVKVFKNIARFRGQCSLKTWIYKVAVSEILNRLRWSRRRFRHQTVSLDDEPVNEQGSPNPIQVPDRGPDPEVALQNRERGDAIQAALTKLSRQHRSIVVLRDVQGFSYEEISQILGVSIGTVKSRLARARDELKKSLARYLSVQRIRSL
jgi:RNA polymerase sigma-70 factor (ECF subfamily)